VPEEEDAAASTVGKTGVGVGADEDTAEPRREKAGAGVAAAGAVVVEASATASVAAKPAAAAVAAAATDPGIAGFAFSGGIARFIGELAPVAAVSEVPVAEGTGSRQEIRMARSRSASIAASRSSSAFERDGVRIEEYLRANTAGKSRRAIMRPPPGEAIRADKDETDGGSPETTVTAGKIGRADAERVAVTGAASDGGAAGDAGALLSAWTRTCVTASSRLVLSCRRRAEISVS
jgi:hypothetical protein